MSRPATLGAAFLAASVASFFIALIAGPFPIPAQVVVDSVLFPTPGVVHDIIWNLRAPRALSAFACGGLLAFSGALLQALLRSELADPYLVGVSGGAALGALLALIGGAGAALIDLAALAGAACAISIVFGLTFCSGERNVYRPLLTGVALAAVLSALVSLVLLTAPPARLKGMQFWLMGDLSDPASPIAALTVLVAGTALATGAARGLDLLSLGETRARSPGVPMRMLRIVVLALAALATAAAVMLAGGVGFVGLVVPHAVRRLGVTADRWLLPLSVLLGGAFLTLADTAARTLVAPAQLPVGVLTAVIGVPLMAWLLGRRRLNS
jgi:iron complex transport system permease protein